MKELDSLQEQLYFQALQLEKEISADLLRREFTEAWRKREKYLDPEDKADVWVDGTKLVIIGREGFSKLAQVYLEEKGFDGFSKQFYEPVIRETIENIAKRFNPSFFLTTEKAEDIFRESETLDFKEDHLADREKQNWIRRIFRLGEKGTANLKKVAAIVTALALAGAAYCFSVHKTQEETKERIKPLIQGGLIREDALNFDKNYKTWAPYDTDEINYAKNLWLPHVTTGEIRQNDALFIMQRYPELLTRPNVLDGDFDGDEIINRTEIFSPYAPLLHLDPLRSNSKIIKSIISQAWINDGISAEEKNVIEKLLLLDQSQPELAEIVVNSSWFRGSISEEDPYIIEAIHDLKQKIAVQISLMQELENTYKTKVDDPETLSQIEDKLMLLQRENLVRSIIEDKLFVVDYAFYEDKKTAIAVTFPSAEMRENVLYTTEKIKVGLPKLEAFVGPFPYDKLQVWYGFIIGNRGGDGKVLTEDRENYEFRRYKDPKLTPLISPFEAGPYHEIAHSYFGKEAIVQFLDMYTYNVVETNSVLPRDWTYLRWGLYKNESGKVAVKPDIQILGYLALMEIYQQIGHDNTSSALKTYYAGAHNEATFINAFTNHSPKNLKFYVSELASYAYSTR